MNLMLRFRCRACGHAFRANVADSEQSMLLRCEQCGQEAWLDFADLADVENRHRKWELLHRPEEAAAASEDDRRILNDPNIELLSDVAYNTIAEYRAGVHAGCGGQLQIDGLLLCPECGSENVLPEDDQSPEA